MLGYLVDSIYMSLLITEKIKDSLPQPKYSFFFPNTNFTKNFRKNSRQIAYGDQVDVLKLAEECECSANPFIIFHLR